MKIAIALSGGVDSAVAAKILKDQGHDLVGLFLKLWSDPTSPCKDDSCQKDNRCCDNLALSDARKVASQLGFPFYAINAQKIFKDEVVNYFLNQYSSFKTPNPCIVCNEKIKFGLLAKRAQELGCQKLATGHYARILNNNSTLAKKDQHLRQNGNHLLMGVDLSKDQSYMLYRLGQKQLSDIIFPLGEMTKKEVRAKAIEWNMEIKEKPESQEICFFDDKDYRDFLKRHLDKKHFLAGDMVTIEGKVVGRHNGLINYTIGQRRGIDQTATYFKLPADKKIPKSKLTNKTAKQSVSDDISPLYVVGFNVKKNQLIVGSDEDVYKKDMLVGNINWINRPKELEEKKSVNLEVKIRYRHKAVGCRLEILKEQRAPNGNFANKKTLSKEERIKVIFDNIQRAITPGQSAVFYRNDEVLGGGIIIN